MTLDDTLHLIESVNAHVEELEKGIDDITAQTAGEISDVLRNTKVTSCVFETIHDALRKQTSDVLQAHASGRQAAEDYRALFEFAPDAYLVTDHAGIILNFNFTAELTFGLPADLLSGRPLALLIAQCDRVDLAKLLTKLKDPQRLQWQTTCYPWNWPPFKSGISVSSTREGNGKPTRLRWLIRDISDQCPG
ncbi:PAS domain-containing protein [Thermodesulfobacteriota bacterium]